VRDRYDGYLAGTHHILRMRGTDLRMVVVDPRPSNVTPWCNC